MSFVLGVTTCKSHSSPATVVHYFRYTPKLIGNQQHLGQRRIQRKFHHFRTNLRQLSRIIQCTQHPELVHGHEDRILWGRVHEIKLEEVADLERFEEKDDIGKVCALDLGDVGGKELVAVCGSKDAWGWYQQGRAWFTLVA